MKKVILILLCCAMLTATISCTRSDDAENDTKSEDAEQTTSVKGIEEDIPPSSQSLNSKL